MSQQTNAYRILHNALVAYAANTVGADKAVAEHLLDILTFDITIEDLLCAPFAKEGF